ncbi:MAG: hypothetical protein CL799_00945 [Chromatiales bacterium]|nr:hypothetical protein [Chromatiales bacterium]
MLRLQARSRPGRLLSLVAGLCVSLTALAELPEPYIAELLASGTYDQELCNTAQLQILNAQPGDFTFNTLVAEGGTFITEQMDADGDSNTVSVASLTVMVQISRQNLAVNVACKQINQARANDILNLQLPAPPGTCRDVNELTYRLALGELTAEQRRQYLADGVPLQFTDDYRAVAGGEWLPSVVSDFITPLGDPNQPEAIQIQAPSVQVPWPGPAGDWFQGTHHCKLITLAAMQRWMTVGSLRGDTELFPRPRPECTEPSSRTSAAGSCLLYFGPAGSQFCQDYSGSGWNLSSAHEDCDIRHSSKTAWDEGGDKYTGDGGVFSAESCAVRGAVAEARESPFDVANSANIGTCVFRCNTPAEALWHQLSPMPGDPDGRMMARTCDLFLKIQW